MYCIHLLLAQSEVRWLIPVKEIFPTKSREIFYQPGDYQFLMKASTRCREQSVSSYKDWARWPLPTHNYVRNNVFRSTRVTDSLIWINPLRGLFASLDNTRIRTGFNLTIPVVVFLCEPQTIWISESAHYFLGLIKYASNSPRFTG